jgi:hypothetical protein
MRVHQLVHWTCVLVALWVVEECTPKAVCLELSRGDTTGIQLKFDEANKIRRRNPLMNKIYWMQSTRLKRGNREIT